MSGSGVLVRIALGALLVVSLAINVPIVAGFVYESVRVVLALDWWGIFAQLGFFLVVLVWWGVPALRDWYENRRFARTYRRIVEARYAESAAAMAAMPTTVTRESFSTLVEAERRPRAGDEQSSAGELGPSYHDPRS